MPSLLMVSTVQPPWVEMHGRDWLVPKPPSSATVIEKGSIRGELQVVMLGCELVSSLTSKMNVIPLIPESGLVDGDW